MSESNSTSLKFRPSKVYVRKVVSAQLKKKAPSGYSLVVPEDGVMYVSDGVKKEHNRWYVVVKPEPEYIADTRRQEYLSILGEVQDMIHKKYHWTVFLTSMLPVV